MADDDGLLRIEIEPEMPEVRMTVVPGHEIAGVMAAQESFAGDIHHPADRGSGGQDDGVIAGSQRSHRDALADLDAAKKAKARHLRDTVEYARHLLQLRMVRRDTEADQAVRHGQTFEHVDVNGLPRSQHGLRGIEAARPSAHDRDAIATLRTLG